MSPLMTCTGRRSMRKPAARISCEKSRTIRAQPRWSWPVIEPGRTPGTAPLLSYFERRHCIPGTFPATQTEHFYKIHIDSETILHLALSATKSVAGLHVARIPDRHSNSSLHAADVLATVSTLIADPVTRDLALGPGSYLIRVYNFFNEADEYLLELSSSSASRALVLLDSRRSELFSEDPDPVPHVAANALVETAEVPTWDTRYDHQSAPELDPAATSGTAGSISPEGGDSVLEVLDISLAREGPDRGPQQAPTLKRPVVRNQLLTRSKLTLSLVFLGMIGAHLANLAMFRDVLFVSSLGCGLTALLNGLIWKRSVPSPKVA
jgi:hypothetical protein